ncbi:MAG: hypothetical protein K5751_06455 [Treponemataceae bacterium]|nr:hypothetical protein [Treponemataceae bacterium]
MLKTLCKLFICTFTCILTFTSCTFRLSETESNQNNTGTTENQINNTATINQPENSGDGTIATVSFSDFTVTPNNGGKYYKIPTGTLDLIITDIPIYKNIRLLRINTSDNSLSGIGTTQLLINSLEDNSKIAAAYNDKDQQFVQIQDITSGLNSSRISAANTKNDDEPYAIPFVDNSDYKSLLYDFSSANDDSKQNESQEPSFMIAGSSSTDYNIGSTKQFYVPVNFYANSLDWYTETATVRAVGTYCYVWVANANYTNSETNTADNKLNDAQAQAFAESFDSLYEKETSLIGNSYTNNPNPSIYINPQNKISIFIYDINGDFVPKQTSGIFGLFWINNFYKRTAGSGQISKSNEMELLYIDSHFADQYPSIMVSTISHEFEHMLYFINKTMLRTNIEGSTWFNEMCAMMTEDLLATFLANQYDDFTIEYDSAIGRLKDFNPDYYKGGILDWKGDIQSYARTGIFGCWLLRNYGGANLLRNIINNSYTDCESLENTIHSMGSTDTLAEAFTKYALSFVQPSATQYTLKKAVNDPDYPLVQANPWDSIYKSLTKFYNGPVYTPVDYSGTLYPYGFWINGWNSGPYTSVRLKISRFSGEQNYLVIID